MPGASQARHVLFANHKEAPKSCVLRSLKDMNIIEMSKPGSEQVLGKARRAFMQAYCLSIVAPPQTIKEATAGEQARRAALQQPRQLEGDR